MTNRNGADLCFRNGHRMRRRELLFLLAGATTTPRALRAQQKAMPVIGFLGVGPPPIPSSLMAAFRQGLSETGYIEGQNVAIEYRFAEGRYDRLPALAAGSGLPAHPADFAQVAGCAAADLTPPASRPCASRRKKCFPLRNGFSARRDSGRPSSERCSNNDYRQ